MAVRFLKVCNTECGYAEFRNAECRYAECHCVECHYVECFCAECCYAECYTINHLLVRFRLMRKYLNRISPLDLYCYLCDLF